MKRSLSVTAVLAVACALAGLVAPRGGARQPPAAGERLRRIRLAGEVREALGRLAAADRLAARGNHADAVEEYRRFLLDGGDDLVPETTPADRAGSARRSVQLRRLCHLRIAALPPAALKLYRDRAEPLADRWLRQAAPARDVHLLRRIVDEAFCTRAAERALDLLGDLAFERGDFAAARRWWLLLVPPVSDSAMSRLNPDRLAFPDPALDPARTRAKQILALVFDGDVRQAEAEVRQFQARHGEAAGRLAGNTGRYADTLRGLLRERMRGPLTPEEEDWPTFAGSPSRQRVLPDALPGRLWTDGPTWRVRLEPPNADGEPPGVNRNEPRALTARRLAFHPIVAGERVLVADARHVSAYRLRTGKLAFRYDLRTGDDARGAGGLRLRLPAPPGLGYTLTAAEGRVYARLGTQALAPPGKGAPGAEQTHSYLVCLDLTAGGREGRERWVVKAADGEPGARGAFEGAPLVHAGRAYAVETTLTVGRTAAALVCHDAQTGARRWRRKLCDAPRPEGEPPRLRHHLLTLAGGIVVYCTHAGAVVAVDGLTGKPLWGVRYPSQTPAGTSDEHLPCGPAPCVAVDRRLFVAPLDSDRIFCLDVETGRTLWEREGTAVVQLIGVSDGRLVFATARGIRALDAHTGDDESGWTQPAVGRLGGFGRGLLAGGWVLWPTEDDRLPLRLLSAADGRQGRGPETIDPTRLRHLRPGNMAYGRGCLVVAGAEEMVGYISPRK